MSSWITPVLQRQVNPKYNHYNSFKRVREVVSSDEMRSADQYIADSPLFPKHRKRERAILSFKVKDQGVMDGLMNAFEWIPLSFQNLKLMNVGMSYVMSLMRQGCKGSGGWNGGNMHQLLSSLKVARKDERYEIVVVMCLDLVPVNEGIRGFLDDNQPILKNLAVGMAKIHDDKVEELVLIAHGIHVVFNF